MNPDEFVCPECGGRKASERRFVDGPFDEADAWSGVLQQMRCDNCHSVIPAHLGERRDNLTVVEAQQEWRKIYRDSQPDWD